MTETSEPESSVEELISRMREGAARRRIDDSFSASREAAQSTNTIDDSSTGSAQFARFASPINVPHAPLALQPEFEPRADDSYHARDLLKYHDRDFVRNAYRAILKRQPDAAGFKQFIEGLRAGQLNKIDVLAQLQRSPEGKAKNVQVNGLQHPARIRSLYRLPFIGYLAQLIASILRLPVLLRSQQQIESYLIAQQQLIADHFNDAHAQLASVTETLASATETLASAQQRQQLAYDALDDRLTTAQQNLDANLAATLASAQQRQQLAYDALDDRLTTAQQNLDANLAASSSHAEAMLAQLSQQTDARFNELAQHSEFRFTQLGNHIEARFAETSAGLQQQRESQRDRLDVLARNLESETARIMEKHQETRAELALQARRISMLLEGARGQLASASGNRELQALAGEDAHTHDALYISLEDKLRGSRDAIIERLKIYLPLLESSHVGGEAMPLLDIGCGRGEWLELLKAEGLNAVGVDTNSIAIAQCRERGFDAREMDALAYLRALPSESVGAVTGFHLVEHLPFDVLMKLLDECVRVVKPGGAVVFETPNPQNVLVGSCNFYFDPTHRHPLPSQMLKFLVESRGFARVEVMNLHPAEIVPVAGDSDIVKRFNELFYGAMDYAVIGWKVKA
ncbi:MAG: methyltransferase domain-containing protein [Pyrinomonadaceae bacterium]